MLTHKYYYDDPRFNNKKYRTLWKGHLTYKGESIPISEDYYQYSNRELDDIITETCNINMYCNLQNNTIYLSSDCDFNFYYYDFEKTIKLLIGNINSKFSVQIYCGEFNAHELRIDGDLYKYTIKELNGKISLKKKILNWEVIGKKRKLENDSEITLEIDKLNLD